MKKRAMITGITGQDGAYLAEKLLHEGYEVFGTFRRSASINTWRLEELNILNQIKLVSLELLEYGNIQRVINEVRPHEFYNLAAQSFVGASFDQPLYTADVDGLAVTRILEAIRLVDPEIKFYQASTSEMFGKVQAIPQNEDTPFYPRSPYGVAKLYGHWITVNYRESFDIHASSGILFNHESPLRGQEFVTRKIASSVARLSQGEDIVLELGNLDAKRDWGFARDYVNGMYLMLQADKPDDYVLATGETYPVRSFVEKAFHAIDLEIEWIGAGENEYGVNRKTQKIVVKVNKKFYRPAEVDLLIGSPTKAESKLGWARSVKYTDLVYLMVQADIDRLKSGKHLN